MKDRISPPIKGKEYFVLFPGDCSVKRLVRFTMSGIYAVITNHLEMFFRDMLSKSCHEIKNRESFSDQFFVFMTIIVKSNKFTVVRINTRSCNDWSAKITANLLNHMRGVAFIGHSSNIKTIFMFGVDRSLKLFKGVTELRM